eukprot:956081-Prymnesium_polylepis.1
MGVALELNRGEEEERRERGGGVVRRRRCIRGECEPREGTSRECKRGCRPAEMRGAERAYGCMNYI